VKTLDLRGSMLHYCSPSVWILWSVWSGLLHSSVYCSVCVAQCCVRQCVCVSGPWRDDSILSYQRMGRTCCYGGKSSWEQMDPCQVWLPGELQRSVNSRRATHCWLCSSFTQV